MAAVALVGCDPATTSAARCSDTLYRRLGHGTVGEGRQACRAQGVANLMGMGLQSAQDKAQADGFFSLKPHDSAGRDRLQAFDQNWKVCSRNYAPDKSVPVDTELDFGTVKLEEACPRRIKRSRKLNTARCRTWPASPSKPPVRLSTREHRSP
ncbi:hypothetical protein ACWGJX_47240 [Streptomyces sp. NPDC054775]